MYTGGAGGYTFYVRDGEQVLRQRKNNSNYGEGASRTQSQMIRRIRWGNLVNVFKAFKSWQPKAYDSKLKGQTDYNIFMGLNISQATAASTKAMNNAGCAVIEGYRVSRGSLPPIATTFVSGSSIFETSIAITADITAATTLGAFARDVVANNPQFVAGDNLAFIFFRNWLAAVTGLPYAASTYADFPLDTASSILLQSIPVIGERLSRSTNGFLSVSFTASDASSTSHEVGFVCVHTRKDASSLAVSSQSIVMADSSIVERFSGAEWDEECIATFGLTDEAMLFPSELVPKIQYVTLNGQEVVDGGSYSSMRDLVITGQFLSADSVRVTSNNIDQTPTSSTATQMAFTLNGSGTIRVYLGEQLYLIFSVSILPTGD